MAMPNGNGPQAVMVDMLDAAIGRAFSDNDVPFESYEELERYLKSIGCFATDFFEKSSRIIMSLYMKHSNKRLQQRKLPPTPDPSNPSEKSQENESRQALKTITGEHQILPELDKDEDAFLVHVSPQDGHGWDAVMAKHSAGDESYVCADTAKRNRWERRKDDRVRVTWKYFDGKDQKTIQTRFIVLPTSAMPVNMALGGKHLDDNDDSEDDEDHSETDSNDLARPELLPRRRPYVDDWQASQQMQQHSNDETALDDEALLRGVAKMNMQSMLHLQSQRARGHSASQIQAGTVRLLPPADIQGDQRPAGRGARRFT